MYMQIIPVVNPQVEAVHVSHDMQALRGWVVIA